MAELTEDNRAPTVAELADRLDEPQELVLEALHAHHARYSVSMQAQLGSEDDGAARLEDRLGLDDEAYDVAEERVVLERLLRMVTERDRRVLRMHFELDMTQREIGDVLGVSQMQVSRIIRHALQRMRLGAARSEELLRQGLRRPAHRSRPERSAPAGVPRRFDGLDAAGLRLGRPARRTAWRWPSRTAA